MNRDEFEQALIPLTSQEIHFRESPHALLHYLPEDQDRDGDSQELFHGEMKMKLFYIHNNIFPDRPQLEPFRSTEIAFNRNDRFSYVPPHSHGFIELNYVLFGTCRATVNDTTFLLETGDLCIMDRNTTHFLHPTGESDIVLNILMAPSYFSYSFLSGLLLDGPVSRFLSDILAKDNAHNQYLLFHTKKSPLVKELIENMFIEYLMPGIACENVLRFHISLLMIELARCYQDYMEDKYQKENRPYLTEILHYMEEHCIDCTLTQVAAHFNFSPNYLSRLLKKETGKGFQDLLSESRLKRVAFLLRSTSLPIYKVANECGYQNQSFFRQKFEEEFGMSPKAWRLSLVEESK